MTARGSQLQTQIYVNRRPGHLNRAIFDALPSLAGRTSLLGWVAPLEPAFAEPRDAEFLESIGCGDLVDELAAFWPRSGPVWDALAVAVLKKGRPGVILAEGKSYPGELYSGGSKASEVSREQILRAMKQTQAALGIEVDPETWLGPLYQLANRVAHVVWLRERGVDAWLVHLLFEGDHTHQPASGSELRSAVEAAHGALGLPPLDYVGEVVLPALAPSELTREPVRA